MYDYHLNFFRPYHHDCRSEMSVTRAFVIACAKSPNGKQLFGQVLREAGITALFSAERIAYGLEVPGRCENMISVSNKFILCISPENTVTKQGMLSELFTSPSDILQSFSSVVHQDGEQPNLDTFRKQMEKVFPQIATTISQEDISSLLSAYWDIWRLLYAGARADGVIQTDDLFCLIESKIWGNVYEVQARNHAQEFFGTTDIPIHTISWQTIYDIAKHYNDSIINDLTEYLAEFPQLVRWNGFDLLDLKAFEINKREIAEEQVVMNRLIVRYWQCMEDLCNTYNYKVFARRDVDWDFTPPDYKLIGNTGIGYWYSGTLSAKWCVGYHAWEMDTIMSKEDILQRGYAACEHLATVLASNKLLNGLSVEIRAVQRFQYANAQDGTWFDGSSFSLVDEGNIADALKSLWAKEFALLKQYHKRRGIQVTADEALAIKREIYSQRYPPNNNLPDAMATKHKSWSVFAALDMFIHVNPKVFCDCATNACLPKSAQLSAMDEIVTALARFAETITS